MSISYIAGKETKQKSLMVLYSNFYYSEYQFY